MMTRFRTIREAVFLLAAIVTIVGAPLAGGIWLGGYAADIKESSVQACEAKWLLETVRKRGTADNHFGNYIQANLNVLSAKLNHENAETEEEKGEWMAAIEREQSASQAHHAAALRLEEEAKLLDDEVAKCRDGTVPGSDQ